MKQALEILNPRVSETNVFCFLSMIEFFIRSEGYIEDENPFLQRRTENLPELSETHGFRN